MRRILSLILMAVILVLASAACAGESDPADSVEEYLRAKVEADGDKLASLACGDFEAQAAQDALSFRSVRAEIENMECQKTGEDGDAALVTCTGQIVAEYDGETRTQDLSETTYRAIEDDGEWKICGVQ